MAYAVLASSILKPKSSANKACKGAWLHSACSVEGSGPDATRDLKGVKGQMLKCEILVSHVEKKHFRTEQPGGSHSNQFTKHPVEAGSQNNPSEYPISKLNFPHS